MLSDDGIGARLAADLKTGFGKDNIHFENLLVAGLDMIESIKNFEQLIIIDGIRSTGGTPGDVKIYGLEDCPPTLHLHTFHDAQLPEAIRIAKLCGINVTEIIQIITIEIYDDLTFSLTLSNTLENIYPKILANVKAMIETFISNPSTLMCYEKI